MRKLISALLPQTRARLLAALTLQPESWWYMTDLAKHLKVTPSTLQRELGRLTQAGLLQRRVDGKRVYFKADEKCPILAELQGVFLKTIGLVDVVAECLKPKSKQISFAVIFGSIAKGEELSGSDIDLLVVGDLGLAELTPLLKKAETRLRREIQAMVYTSTEFQAKLHRKDHFLSAVMKGPLLPVLGEVNEYLEEV